MGARDCAVFWFKNAYKINVNLALPGNRRRTNARRVKGAEGVFSAELPKRSGKAKLKMKKNGLDGRKANAGRVSVSVRAIKTGQPVGKVLVVLGLEPVHVPCACVRERVEGGVWEGDQQTRRRRERNERDILFLKSDRETQKQTWTRHRGLPSSVAISKRNGWGP
jgi:hypothetical protein